jgi:hypothetical protein
MGVPDMSVVCVSGMNKLVMIIISPPLKVSASLSVPTHKDLCTNEPIKLDLIYYPQLWVSEETRNVDVPRHQA